MASQSFRALMLLWLITIIWGTTFWIIQQSLTDLPATWLMVLRFAWASVVLAPFALNRSLSWTVIKQGAALGTAAGLGFTLQTLALAETSVPRAAFATALSTILVPVASLLWHRRFDGIKILATLLAGLGLYSLFGVDLSEPLGLGDGIALASAFAFTAQILLIGALRPSNTTLLPLMFVQTTVAACMGMVALCYEGQPLSWSALCNLPVPLGALMYLSVIATSFCLWGQAWGQRYVSSSQAAFIFALEPIFASLFAWWMDGTAMTDKEILGGGLIVMANLLAELPIATSIRHLWHRRHPISPQHHHEV